MLARARCLELASLSTAILGSPGGTWVDLEARTTDIRSTAEEYAGLIGRYGSVTSDIAASGSALAAEVTHPAVQQALGSALSAVTRQLLIAGLGVSHAQQGLSASADAYDSVDAGAADHIQGLLRAH